MLDRRATTLNALHLRTYPPVIATWPINSLAPDTCESATCLGTSSVVTRSRKVVNRETTRRATARRRFYGQNVRKVRERRTLSHCHCVYASVSYPPAVLHAGLRSIAISAFVCLSVGLSACVSQNTRRLNFIKLLCMLLVAVARSSYDENAIRYVLPVFIRHNCDANLRTGQTQ